MLRVALPLYRRHSTTCILFSFLCNLLLLLLILLPRVHPATPFQASVSGRYQRLNVGATLTRLSIRRLCGWQTLLPTQCIERYVRYSLPAARPLSAVRTHTHSLSFLFDSLPLVTPILCHSLPVICPCTGVALTAVAFMDRKHSPLLRQ